MKLARNASDTRRTVPTGNHRRTLGGPAADWTAQDAHTTGERIVTEIIFEIVEDEVDGGYSASALGYGIHTQGDSIEEVRANVKEAVDCYFDDSMARPKLIRLHFVRDEVLVA